MSAPAAGPATSLAGPAGGARWLDRRALALLRSTSPARWRSPPACSLVLVAAGRRREHHRLAARWPSSALSLFADLPLLETRIGQQHRVADLQRALHDPRDRAACRCRTPCSSRRAARSSSTSLGGSPPLKAVFNAANFAIAMTCAGLGGARRVAGRRSTAPRWSSILACCSAPSSSSCSTAAASRVAVSLSQRAAARSRSTATGCRCGSRLAARQRARRRAGRGARRLEPRDAHHAAAGARRRCTPPTAATCRRRTSATSGSSSRRATRELNSLDVHHRRRRRAVARPRSCSRPTS